MKSGGKRQKMLSYDTYCLRKGVESSVATFEQAEQAIPRSGRKRASDRKSGRVHSRGGLFNPESLAVAGGVAGLISHPLSIMHREEKGCPFLLLF